MIKTRTKSSLTIIIIMSLLLFYSAGTAVESTIIPASESADEPYVGFAITTTETALRDNTNMEDDSTIITVLAADTLIYLNGQASMGGIIWTGAQTYLGESTIIGLISFSSVKAITPTEAQEYIDAYNLANSNIHDSTPNPNNAFDQYISNNNVRLDNYDVQYNKVNNLDKEFVLIGFAELDDYYNYGFSDLEKDYFCLHVTPEDGKYSNSWYIYCHRSSASGLFESIMNNGTKYVKMVCYIPAWIYDDGQGCMAMLRIAVY